MMFFRDIFKKDAYQPLFNKVEDDFNESASETPIPRTPKPTTLVYPQKFLIVSWAVISAVVGFTTGVLLVASILHNRNGHSSKHGASHIQLPIILRNFVYSSPFSREPPQGEESGTTSPSEPVWDALVPSELQWPPNTNSLH